MEFRSQPLGRSPRFRTRALASAAVLACLLGAVGARVTYLTTWRGSELAAQAEDNLQATRRLEAPRGNIFDRHGTPLALNRRTYTVTYSRYGRSSAEVRAVLARVGELLDNDAGSRADTILETRPSWTRHTIAESLPQDAVVAIMERPDDFRGVRLHETYRREYPEGSLFALVVGFVGRIPAESVDRYAAPLYRPDALVGRAGLEAAYEMQLVGKPGRQRMVRDARGRLLEEPEVEQPARPGDDLVLAIDAELQRKADELLAGVDGTIVLMDVETGELAAFASSPGFDPTAPWKREVDGQPVSYLHRGFKGVYPPGSTFKLVTANAILRDGRDPKETVRCDGGFLLEGWNRRFGCDAKWGHGPMNLVSALQYSCNVYFYDAANEMGGERLLAEAHAWGFGRSTGIDLPGERAGAVTPDGNAPGAGETLNISIGQGAFLSTPLQVAVAFAALANGGDLVQPHVVSEVRSGDGESRTPIERVVTGRAPLDARDRELLLEGFWRAVNQQGGTAFKVGFPIEWDVAGKTGTAENGKGGVDAWFVGVYPRANPRWVAVAHVEEADGHGGEIAGPMVRALIERQKQLEVERPTRVLGPSEIEVASVEP